jgi:hypothetical protein
MSRILIIGSFGFLAFLFSATPAHAADARAVQILRLALAAQGGEDQLRSIRTVQWRARGYRNVLEQSERPEGPYITEFRNLTEVHDFERNRYRSLVEQTIYPEFRTTSGMVADATVAMRLFGERAVPGNADALAMARESLALSPERLLITAIDASDVRLDPSAAIVQSVPQDVVTFTLDGAPVRLFLNRYTHLPTALESSGVQARDGFWRFLGDVTMRTYFSYWWVGDRGIRLPMQWDIFRNGLHDSSFMIASLALDAPVVEAEMQIPSEIRSGFAQAAAAPRSPQRLQAAVEVAPGVDLVPGSWNVLIVRQGDGIVVLEAPISSAYSEQILAEIDRRYPGVPIKALVTTSDAWPHIAGVRAYVARGIPIYALDLNRPILERLLQSRYSFRPDALERQPRVPILHSVDGKITIGTGPTQIDLYPIRGEVSERQIMAFFPNLRLLYGSDPFQQGPNGSFRTIQAVSELVAAAARERLHPTRFTMMHVGMTPWEDLTRTLRDTTVFPAGALN